MTSDGSCVLEADCEVCVGDEGEQDRRLGEEWDVDACTSCTCRKSKRNKVSSSEDTIVLRYIYCICSANQEKASILNFELTGTF